MLEVADAMLQEDIDWKKVWRKANNACPVFDWGHFDHEGVLCQAQKNAIREEIERQLNHVKKEKGVREEAMIESILKAPTGGGKDAD